MYNLIFKLINYLSALLTIPRPHKSDLLLEVKVKNDKVVMHVQMMDSGRDYM